MENWGLITLEKSILVNDPENISSFRFADNASTVTHEVSHQWFGNIVTMDWWDDLWLNEGLTTFFEDYILDKLRP